MAENKRKHLEFIQNVITRMNTNSFLLKGWLVAIIAAIFSLGIRDHESYIKIIIFCIFIFWFLDGFYLAQERKFRDLYNDVITKNERSINFSMSTEAYLNDRNSWIFTLFSPTLLTYYGLIALMIFFLSNY